MAHSTWTRRRRSASSKDWAAVVKAFRIGRLGQVPARQEDGGCIQSLRPFDESPCAGWPRAVTHPRLPQIRTCPIRASGSSGYGLATQRYTLCTTRACGKGKVLRSPPNRSHVIRPRQTPVQPLAPSPLDFVSQALQRLGVAGDSVAGVVASQLAAQRRVLVSHPPMTMRPAPLASRLQRPAEAAPRFNHSGAGLGGLALHHPSPLPGASPIMGEPQHREAAPALYSSTRALVRAAAVHPPGLVRGQAQSVPLHPLRQPRPHPPLQSCPSSPPRTSASWPPPGRSCRSGWRSP